MLEFYFSVCYCEIPLSVGVFDNKVMLIPLRAQQTSRVKRVSTLLVVPLKNAGDGIGFIWASLQFESVRSYTGYIHACV